MSDGTLDSAPSFSVAQVLGGVSGQCCRLRSSRHASPWKLTVPWTPYRQKAPRPWRNHLGLPRFLSSCLTDQWSGVRAGRARLRPPQSWTAPHPLQQIVRPHTRVDERLGCTLRPRSAHYCQHGGEDLFQNHARMSYEIPISLQIWILVSMHEIAPDRVDD